MSIPSLVQYEMRLKQDRVSDMDQLLEVGHPVSIQHLLHKSVLN